MQKSQMYVKATHKGLTDEHCQREGGHDEAKGGGAVGGGEAVSEVGEAGGDDAHAAGEDLRGPAALGALLCRTRKYCKLQKIPCGGLLARARSCWQAR